jgi:uncharacterized protein (TIGR02145 family)
MKGFREIDMNTIIDERDGKTYFKIKIGNQEWLGENLAYKPKNGTYWIYNNYQNTLNEYGYLYDWKTANMVAPKGWHLPSIEDWEILYKCLGNEPGQVYQRMTLGGKYGFNAIGGGVYSCLNGQFVSRETSYFWSSIDFNEDKARNVLVGSGEFNVVSLNSSTHHASGLSVRLMRDLQIS